MSECASGPVSTAVTRMRAPRAGEAITAGQRASGPPSAAAGRTGMPRAGGAIA